MGLQFLNPLFLAGLSLAAVPFLIHLISRRKAKRVPFAALEFVLRSTRRQTRHIRLRELLLLLVRTGLVVSLALAVAGPRWVIQAATSPEPATARVGYCLDASASMRAQSIGADDLFAQARRRLANHLRTLAPDVPVTLFLARQEVEVLVEPPSFDRAAVLRALDAAAPSFERSDLSQCVARAAATAEVDAQGLVRVVVVTDGAAHAWSGGPIEASGMAVELLRVPGPDAPQLDNRAIQELSVAPSVGSALQAYDVEFSIKRFAGVAAETQASVEVLLSIGERPISRVTVGLTPDGVAHKRFMQVPLEQADGTQVVLQVSMARDSMPFDDRALRPLELPREVKVVIVNGDPQTVRHRDEVFFLERALERTVVGRERLRTRIVNVDGVKVHDIAGADVVVLANVESLGSEVAEALVRRVEGGGGLWITMGDRVDPDFYNGALSAILPASLRGPKSFVPLDNPNARALLSLQRTALDHPLFVAVTGSADLGLARARFGTVMLVHPGSTTDRRLLLRFSNGTPALVERLVGRGRVLMLNTSVDRDWGDLAIRPGFVPLVQQTLLYLADAIEVPRPRRFAVGSVVEIEVPRGAESIEVVDPEDHLFELRPDPDGPGRFAQTQQPGLYQVRALMADGARRELADRRFAINVDPRESETALVDLSILQASLPAGAPVSYAGAEPRGDQPLWHWLLLGLALWMLLETLVLRRP